MSKKTHQTSPEIKLALLSNGFAWQKSMKQAPQPRATAEHLRSREKKSNATWFTSVQHRETLC